MPPPPHTLALTLSLPQLWLPYPLASAPTSVYASAAFAMTDDAKPSPVPSLVHYMPKFDGGEEAKHSDHLRSLSALPAPSATLNHSDTWFSHRSSLVEQYALSQLPTSGQPPSRQLVTVLSQPPSIVFSSLVFFDSDFLPH
ncbi:hypothetical protein B0H14DRAFT_3429030 [Mycena olivaceomarginata]|nr:hypothetical protein B0H14DRAFT_3429030 [Mycena olivaceomarginata]